MGKQYTFKTTVDTTWLEEHLDKLPKAERSRYIRMALCVLFDKVRPAVTQGQTVTPDVTPNYTLTPSAVPDYVGETITVIDSNGNIKFPKDEPVFEALDEDLDSKLDNLFD